RVLEDVPARLASREREAPGLELVVITELECRLELAAAAHWTVLARGLEEARGPAGEELVVRATAILLRRRLRGGRGRSGAERARGVDERARDGAHEAVARREGRAHRDEERLRVQRRERGEAERAHHRIAEERVLRGDDRRDQIAVAHAQEPTALAQRDA